MIMTIQGQYILLQSETLRSSSITLLINLSSHLKLIKDTPE